MAVQDLEDLLRGSHPDGADSAIPCSTLDLLLHVVEAHVDNLLDVVVELEMELDELERQLDSGTATQCSIPTALHCTVLYHTVLYCTTSWMSWWSSRWSSNGTWTQVL